MKAAYSWGQMCYSHKISVFPHAQLADTFWDFLYYIYMELLHEQTDDSELFLGIAWVSTHSLRSSTRPGETLQILESLHTPDKLLFFLAQPRSIMVVSMAAFSHYSLEPVGKWPGLKMPGGLGKSLDCVPLSFLEGPRKGWAYRNDHSLILVWASSLPTALCF